MAWNYYDGGLDWDKEANNIYSNAGLAGYGSSGIDAGTANIANNIGNDGTINWDSFLGYTPSGMEGAKLDLDLGSGSNSWFGKSGILPTAFQGLSALGGLMQAYTGLKGLGLMKDQLENSKNAFRTQFEANKTSVGEGVRNAAATNYAMHRGTARNFNEDEQRQVADAEANRVKNSYKSYI